MSGIIPTEHLLWIIAIAATITMLIFIAWMIHDIIYPPESDGWY
jgi:phage shock protein PspC (stress-responsive transcriptional regulator)